MKPVGVQLPTSTDNVALPTFAAAFVHKIKVLTMSCSPMVGVTVLPSGLGAFGSMTGPVKNTITITD